MDKPHIKAEIKKLSNSSYGITIPKALLDTAILKLGKRYVWVPVEEDSSDASNSPVNPYYGALSGNPFSMVGFGFVGLVGLGIVP